MAHYRDTLTLPDCPICKNERVVPGPRGTPIECVCVTRAEVSQYLGTNFDSALARRLVRNELSTDRLAGKNLIIHNPHKLGDFDFVPVWRSTVKEYLLSQYRARSRLSYEVCMGAKELVDEVFRQMRDRDGEIAVHRYDRFISVDLLVLSLYGDPKNEQNSCVLNLLRNRLAHARPTWIVTPYCMAPNDGNIERQYGRELAEYIKPSVGDKAPGGGGFEILNVDSVIEAVQQRRRNRAA